jgi:predicted nucleic acid-binding protein
MQIIADSTFYLCFLDDIKKPDYLLLVIKKLDLFIGKIVKTEIEKSSNFSKIRDFIGNRITYFEYADFGELLKPFFSSVEIMKGENEVIAISFILYKKNENILVVIDDEGARKFVMRNVQEISDKMIRTVGIVKYLCEDRLFSKTETINVLNMIKNSKFRVPESVIEDCISEVSSFI